MISPTNRRYSHGGSITVAVISRKVVHQPIEKCPSISGIRILDSPMTQMGFKVVVGHNSLCHCYCQNGIVRRSAVICKQLKHFTLVRITFKSATYNIPNNCSVHVHFSFQKYNKSPSVFQPGLSSSFIRTGTLRLRT